MSFRIAQIELPRRVAAYHLLFCVIAVAWLVFDAVNIVWRIEDARLEKTSLAALHRSTDSIALEYLRNGESALQPAVERTRSAGGLAYCAIVSPDGHFLAHSSPHRVGQVYREPVGERDDSNDHTRVRFVDENARMLREYRAPLEVGNSVLGSLHIAAVESGLWRTVGAGAQYIASSIVGVSFIVVLGGVIVYRAVRPVAQIERQLRAVARAGVVQEIDLRPVPIRTGAALGWNRVVAGARRKTQPSSLDSRLRDAVDRREDERHEWVLHSLPEGVAVTDDTGQITFANHAAAAILDDQANAEGLCGRTMEDCLGFGGDTSSPDATGPAPALGRSATVEVTLPHRHDDRVYRVSRSPLRQGDGKSDIGHVWMIRDVTQQKLSEKTRDQFLDAATHELRTPLANIKAYAETLSLSDMLDIEQQKEFCNTINAEATRLARFIDDLLCVSSMEVGSLSMDRQEVDVERLLQEATRKVQPQIDQKRIRFESILPAKLPKLRLDKDKVSAVLVNLLGNAAKYTPKGGRIALTVRATEDQLFIEIQDSGVGISREELPRIFDKFFRSEDPRVRQQTGTGLGLAFADEVVRKHGGTLEVTSEFNKGSTFTVTLPVD